MGTGREAATAARPRRGVRRSPVLKAPDRSAAEQMSPSSVSKSPDSPRRDGSPPRPLGRPPVPAAHVQRRILAALGEEVAGAGFDRLTVRVIACRAGISRRTFYDHFPGRDEAFIAAHERAFSVLAERIEGACATQPGWPQQVREALAAALDLAASSPAGALLVLADPFAAGPHADALRERLFDLLVPALRRGRALCAVEPCPALEQALLGGLLAFVAGRLREGRAASLSALAPPLTRFALSPYVGGVEAERIAGDRCA